MKSSDLGKKVIRKELALIPKSPGIYRMLNHKGDILYVGKAKNLPNRLKNYVSEKNHIIRTERMLSQTFKIEITTTANESEALLLEANLIKKFKPKFNFALATLTGAIIVSLGEEYAGLFSNNDELSKNIFKASENVNEKVWRLPLHKNYDKLMDSTIADVQNINYSGGAGSITAAQFLQRFILNKTPWAHLDIAGMAFSKKAANLNPSGATGFGVRLLNNLIY